MIQDNFIPAFEMDNSYITKFKLSNTNLRGCKLNCVIFIFDSTVGDRPSAKGVHQHSRRA